MRSSSARARTDWPRRSRSRARASRCTWSSARRRSAAGCAPPSRRCRASSTTCAPPSTRSPSPRRSSRRCRSSEHGVEWIWPPAALAHPFDDGTAALLERSPDATGVTLGEDARRYARLMRPLARDAPLLLEDLLGPLGRPRHPLALARFASRAALPATSFARTAFRGERARAFFAGLAAHSMLPLSRSPTTGYGLMLGLLGHAVGWPLARGGSQTLADALASYLRSLGGTIETGRNIGSLGELDGADALLLDVGPHQFVATRRRAAPEPLPAARSRATATAPGSSSSTGRSTVRSPGGRRSARAPRPFISAARSLRSPPRSGPRGAASTADASVRPARAAEPVRSHPRAGRPAHRLGVLPRPERLSGRHDRPDRAAGRAVRTRVPRSDPRCARRWGPPSMEHYNPNYVGGDINGGAGDLRQFFTRPVARASPYTTPLDGVFLCSSSTPPGGGVHGMCGYHAAQAALRHLGVSR